jgi:hypothetical protein
MRKIEAIVAAACIAMACWSSMTAIASLRRESGPVDRVPPSAAETPTRPFIDKAAAGRPSPQGVCNDLEFSFVHSTCVKMHKKKHFARTSHRIATLVIGSAAASLSLSSASMRSATVSQGSALSGGAVAPDVPRAGNDRVAKGSSDPSLRHANEDLRANRANAWSGSRDRKVGCRQSWSRYDPPCLRDQIPG